MATNIEEALSGGGLSVSAKPVTMEALPEATIDVGGGSQSLEIEGLGVKRKKDDLSVTTSSTSQIAIQDLFGDLLDEVNFSDPSSVDAFRDAASTRIDEFDSDSIGRILGEASTVAGDLAAFSTAFTGEDTSQNQFRRVFGPPAIPSLSGDSGGDFDSGFDSGLDTSTSTAAQDFSDLTDPEAAAGLVGSAIGALGPGGSLGSFATGVGRGALSSAGFANVFGGFNAANSLANAEISNPAQALGAVSTALQVGQTVNSVAAFAQQNKSVADIFSNVTKNVEEYVENIYSAITNPEQTLGAFGMQMAYGTLTPDLYSFEFPGGPLNFAFDAKTGMIAEPGFLSFMMGMTPNPMSSVYSVAQRGLGAIGYKGAMADRNQSAVNAFSMPGINLGPMSIHTGVDALTGIDPETGAASAVGAFGAIDMSAQGFGTVGMDLGALAEAMGAGTIGDLSFTDYQDAAISGHLGHGPLGFDAYSEEEAMAEDLAAAFDQAGINNAQDIADRAEQASIGNNAFAAALEEISGEKVGEIGYGALDRASALAMSPAAVARDLKESDPAGFFETALLGLQQRQETISAGLLGMMTREEIQTYSAAQVEAMKAAAGQSLAVDYNAQAPQPETIAAMEILGFTNISMNLNQDLDKKADLAALRGVLTDKRPEINSAIADKADYDFYDGLQDAFGFSSLNSTIDAVNNEPLSGMDYGMSMGIGDVDPGGAIEAGYDIGFDAASQGGGAIGGGVENIGDAEAAEDAGRDDVSDPGADIGPAEDSHDDSPSDCFIKGTPVLMQDGSTKAIEKIAIGDLVAGKDGNANEVKATHIRKPDIPFLYGFNGHKPFVTAYHPFMTKEGWGCFEPEKFKEHRPTAYQELADEQDGKDLIKIKKDCEILRSDNEWVLVEDVVVEGCDPNLTVYNLSVANDKTFVANNYIVHNKGGGPGGKIICTAMNKMYGFGSYRNALWMKYQSSHMAAEEYELGYHKLVMPLVKKMPTNKTIRTVLERIARRRTINIRKELRGQKLPLYYRSMKYTVRPLLFAVGWLVKKNLLSKTQI